MNIFKKKKQPAKEYKIRVGEFIFCVDGDPSTVRLHDLSGLYLVLQARDGDKNAKLILGAYQTLGDNAGKEIYPIE